VPRWETVRPPTGMFRAPPSAHRPMRSRLIAGVRSDAEVLASFDSQLVRCLYLSPLPGEDLTKITDLMTLVSVTPKFRSPGGNSQVARCMPFTLRRNLESDNELRRLLCAISVGDEAQGIVPSRYFVHTHLERVSTRHTSKLINQLPRMPYRTSI
jgi:hypothetical protein